MIKAVSDVASKQESTNQPIFKISIGIASKSIILGVVGITTGEILWQQSTMLTSQNNLKIRLAPARF
jgi:hypothetical protein